MFTKTEAETILRAAQAAHRDKNYGALRVIRDALHGKALEAAAAILIEGRSTGVHRALLTLEQVDALSPNPGVAFAALIEGDVERAGAIRDALKDELHWAELNWGHYSGPGALDPRRVEADLDEVRALIALSCDGAYILGEVQAGRWTPDQGIHHLVSAAKFAGDFHQRLRFELTRKIREAGGQG